MSGLRRKAVMLALALAITPGCSAAHGKPARPGSVRCPDNVADTVAARFEVGGFSLDQSRSAISSRIGGLAIARQSARKFADGGEELRLTLKDGSFIRVAFPAAGDAAGSDVRSRAIIYSAGSSDDPNVLLGQLLDRLGPPVWKDAPTIAASHRLVWGGRGEPEGGIAPLRCSAIVVALERVVRQPVTLTIARAGWFQSKRG